MTKLIPTTILGGVAATVCLIGLIPAAHAEQSPARRSTCMAQTAAVDTAASRAEHRAEQPSSEVGLAHVYFTPGDGYLTGDTRDALDQIVAAAQQRRVHRIEVHGHSDERGKPAINLEMSNVRAQRVAAYLIKRGIEPSLVTARAYGKLHPMVVGAANEEEHQQNRRASIQIEWSKSARR